MARLKIRFGLVCTCVHMYTCAYVFCAAQFFTCFFKSKPYWVQWDLLLRKCAFHGSLNLLLCWRNVACSFTGYKHLHCPSKPYRFDLLHRVFQQCLLAMEKQISWSSFIFLPYMSTLTLGKLNSKSPVVESGVVAHLHRESFGNGGVNVQGFFLMLQLLLKHWKKSCHWPRHELY